MREISVGRIWRFWDVDTHWTFFAVSLMPLMMFVDPWALGTLVWDSESAPGGITNYHQLTHKYAWNKPVIVFRSDSLFSIIHDDIPLPSKHHDQCHRSHGTEVCPGRPPTSRIREAFIQVSGEMHLSRIGNVYLLCYFELLSINFYFGQFMVLYLRQCYTSRAVLDCCSVLLKRFAACPSHSCRFGVTTGALDDHMLIEYKTNLNQ